MLLRLAVMIALLPALAGCADVGGGEGWSLSRAASESLRRQGCGNTVLDNPGMAQQLMASGFSGGGRPPSGAPVLGCAVRMGNTGPG